MTQRVAVLGLGNWGTALANHLASKGIEVVGWSTSPEIVAGINEQHTNPRYLSDVALHKSLRATASLDETLSCESIVLAFPSGALAEILPQLKKLKRGLFISAIKGLEMSSRLTPLQFAAKTLPADARLAVISGPSFARDVVLRKPCGVVAAAATEETAREVAELFASDSMKLYISTDPVGVELGGILKNVITLAVGVSDGLGLGDSARAGLITRGLAEMMRIAQTLGADVRTLSGLSGLGDLAMSATSDLSRNRTVGVRLGKGEKLQKIVESLGSVAEGVKTSRVVHEITQEHKIDAPITAHVVKLLDGEITAQEAVRALLSRPTRRET